VTVVLAVQGLGDGLKALDAYQLAPTTDNLMKLRLEMEKLGPAGEEFVHFLDSLEPQLSNLQQIARAGLFPGVEDGITSLLTRLPQVQRIVGELATGMGNLADEAGHNLAGSKFDAFFNYLETDARPTLEAFAHATGNIAEGVANLIVGFAPLNRDFTKGLLGVTEAFAKWSRGLNQNQSFQNFLAYIRQSGPQVAELLGSMAQAIGGLAHAAAPMGRAVVPALTAVAKVFAVIAQSPIGPPLYAAAAGLVAFNRAAKLTSSVTESLAGNWQLLGAEATTLKGKLTYLGAAGAATTLAVGTFLDELDRIDSHSRSSDTLDSTVKSFQDLQETISGSNLGKYTSDLHIDLARLTDDLAKNGASGEYVQRVMQQLQGDTHGAGAAFKAFLGEDLPFYTGNTLKSERALKDLNSILGEVGNGLGKAPGLFGGVIDSLKQATNAAHDLSGALAELSGWFDKREAVRSYRDSIDALSKSIKDGFSRKDAENLDQVGRNILQVAQTIKNPALQHDFLQGARKSLEGLATGAGPKAAAAIQHVIDKMDDSHLTHPPHPKLDVDTSAADSKINDVTIHLRRTAQIHTEPKIDANASAAFGVFNAVQHMLSALDGDTATTYVRTVHQNVFPPGGGRVLGGNADGGTIGGPRHPYGDKVLSMLAPGEEVISNRHGQADRFRADRAAGRIPRYADGGTAGRHATMFTSQEGADAIAGAHSLAQALKMLQAALAKSEKALTKETQARDDLQSQFDSIKSTVGSAYSTRDPFGALQQSGSPWAAGGGMGNPLAAFDTAVAGNTADTKAAQTALAFAASHGLDGPLYAALAASGNLPLLQAFANLSSAEIDQREQAFAAQSNAQSALGGMAANAEVGAQLADANKHLDKIRIEVRELRHDVKQADQNNQKAQDKNAKDVKDGVNGAASNGHKRGQR
jgi:hypothetical protein